MRLTVALWLIFAGLCVAGPEESAVLVRHYAHGAIDAGSGTVVRSEGTKSWVLTNWHVASDPGERVTVELAGKVYGATWLRADSGIDLALLRVDASLPPALLASTHPAPGVRLRQFGHPHAGPMKAKTGPAGEINGRRMVPGGGEVFGVGIGAESGDSGCGVFDPDGKLCAVCWGAGQGAESCVCLKDIKAFLEKVK
jgi:hypothetical protein